MPAVPHAAEAQRNQVPHAITPSLAAAPPPLAGWPAAAGGGEPPAFLIPPAHTLSKHGRGGWLCVPSYSAPDATHCFPDASLAYLLQLCCFRFFCGSIICCRIAPLPPHPPPCAAHACTPQPMWPTDAPCPVHCLFLAAQSPHHRMHRLCFFSPPVQYLHPCRCGIPPTAPLSSGSCKDISCSI